MIDDGIGQGEVLRPRVGAAEADAVHARALCGEHTGRRVLEDEAVLGRHAEALSAQEVDGRIRLALRQCTAREDLLEVRPYLERIEHCIHDALPR